MSIAGVHVPTLSDGSFSLEGVPAGLQRITVFSETGHYLSQDRLVELSVGGTAQADFDLTAAQPVNLTLEVAPPADLPEQARLHVSGNLNQLGSIYYSLNTKMAEHGLRAVEMSPAGSDYQTITLPAYEGAYLEFQYTFGVNLINQERDLGGEQVVRYVVPGATDLTLHDQLAAFKVNGQVTIETVATVPDTVEVDQLLIRLQGGGADFRAYPLGDGSWGYRWYSFASDNPMNYRYALQQTHELLDGTGFRSLTPNQDRQLTDAVEKWRDIVAPGTIAAYPVEPVAIAARDRFAAGVLPLDYWNPEFLAMLPGLLGHLKSAVPHANTVSIVQTADYETIDPPKFRYRSVRSGSVRAPVEELEAAIDLIHQAGFEIFYREGPNPEMALDASSVDDALDKVFGPHSNAWLDAWMAETETMYLGAARLAARKGLAYMFVPQTDLYSFEDESYKAVVNQWMLSVIDKIRAIAPETKLVAERFNISDWSWYDTVDFIGYKIWDRLEVSAEPTVAEIKSAFDQILENTVKPLRDLHNKPVILTEVAYPSVPDSPNQPATTNVVLDDDPAIEFDPVAQARVWEGLMQSIAERPWVQGVFAFGYHYAPLNASKDYSIRGKPAEKVLETYLERFAQEVP